MQRRHYSEPQERTRAQRNSAVNERPTQIWPPNSEFNVILTTEVLRQHFRNCEGALLTTCLNATNLANVDLNPDYHGRKKPGKPSNDLPQSSGVSEFPPHARTRLMFWGNRKVLDT